MCDPRSVGQGKETNQVFGLLCSPGCDVDRDDVDFRIEKELSLEPKGIGSLIHKAAEKYRGYLIHISATYEAIVPYLKGLHLTLDGWREGRDDEGWKDPGWSKFHRHDHNLSSY